jgi:uncharacterized protein YjbI with pentapeptide repeats
MADESQLEILKQGVGAWNEWRRKRRKDIQVDLSGANLRAVIRHGANLSEANLATADLLNQVR